MRRQRAAAIKVQAQWRLRIAAHFRELIVARRHAANRVSSTWHMVVAKRKLNRMKAENAAAEMLTQVIHNTCHASMLCFEAIPLAITPILLSPIHLQLDNPSHAMTHHKPHNVATVSSEIRFHSQVPLRSSDSAELPPHETPQGNS